MRQEQLFWERMRHFTRARIGTGRAGTALTTAAMLEFQLAYARARDAIYHPFDRAAMTRAITPTAVCLTESAAGDRPTYLRRPDLGRRLNDESTKRLAACRGDWDLIFVVGDGLSARAVETYAAAVINSCLGFTRDLRVGPIVLATQARVALGDHVASILGANAVMMLIGERPGLSVADSLGIYFTYKPYVGMPDSGRNCISNIHAHGLDPAVAAHKATWLIREASRIGLSGIGLKENAGSMAPEIGHVPSLPSAIPSFL